MREVQRPYQWHCASRQRGLVLVVALIWLLVATLLLLSSVQNALHEQKAARAFRDRAIAFQAAEAGLVDAESDIEASPSAALSRSTMFAANRSDGFPTDEQALCRQAGASRSRGLCRAAQGNALLSLLADDVDASSTSAVAVEYGRFTGRTLQTGGGALPARLPRYVIELLRDHDAQFQSDAGSTTPAYLYRITAIGFGPQPHTQVVLQSFYRKGMTS